MNIINKNQIVMEKELIKEVIIESFEEHKVKVFSALNLVRMYYNNDYISIEEDDDRLIIKNIRPDELFTIGLFIGMDIGKEK